MVHRLTAAVLTLVVGCGPDKAIPSSDESSVGPGTTAMSSATDTPTSGATGGDAPCIDDVILEGSFEVWPDEPPKFRCVTEIRGDLSFVSNGFDTDQFAWLRRVTGTLSLIGCAHYTYLSGLDSVGSLVFEQPYACVTDFTGLEGLHTIESTLRIADAPGLLSLDGLQGVVNGPARVELRNLPLLKTLKLNLGAQVESIDLRDLPALEVLELNLGAHVDSVQLSFLSKISDLQFLGPVETIGTLSLVGLHAVESLEGLANLQTADRLEIGGCPGQGTSGMDGLNDLTGLGSLTAVDTLVVVGNDALKTLSGAPNLTTFATAVFADNKSLSPDNIAEFLLQNSGPQADVCIDDMCNCP